MNENKVKNSYGSNVSAFFQEREAKESKKKYVVFNIVLKSYNKNFNDRWLQLYNSEELLNIYNILDQVIGSDNWKEKFLINYQEEL